VRGPSPTEESVARQLEKYEGWIAELEARQRELASDRAFYVRLFIGIVPVSALGFLWHRLLGMGTLFTGVLMCVFGFYFLLVRESDYTHHLALLRATAQELREKKAECPPQSPIPVVSVRA